MSPTCDFSVCWTCNFSCIQINLLTNGQSNFSLTGWSSGWNWNSCFIIQGWHLFTGTGSKLLLYTIMSWFLQSHYIAFSYCLTILWYFITSWFQADPLYSHYQCLRCELVPLKVGSAEFSMVSSSSWR